MARTEAGTVWGKTPDRARFLVFRARGRSSEMPPWAPVRGGFPQAGGAQGFEES